MNVKWCKLNLTISEAFYHTVACVFQHNTYSNEYPRGIAMHIPMKDDSAFLKKLFQLIEAQDKIVQFSDKKGARQTFRADKDLTALETLSKSPLLISPVSNSLINFA